MLGSEAYSEGEGALETTWVRGGVCGLTTAEVQEDPEVRFPDLRLLFL